MTMSCRSNVSPVSCIVCLNLTRIKEQPFSSASQEIGALARDRDDFEKLGFVHEHEVQWRKRTRPTARIPFRKLLIRWMAVDKCSVGESGQISSLEAGDTVRIADLTKDLPPCSIKPIPDLNRSEPDRLDRFRHVQTIRRVATWPRHTRREIERSRTAPERANIGHREIPRRREI